MQNVSEYMSVLALCLVQYCYFQLMLMLLYDSLNLVVSGVKLWTVSGHAIAQQKGSGEFCSAAVGLR